MTVEEIDEDYYDKLDSSRKSSIQAASGKKSDTYSNNNNFPNGKTQR